MHNVVYEGLTNIWIPNNVSLIGKTGTAQIANPKGGYLHGEYDYIKSFAGIFPEDDPKYIIYVSVKKMQGTTKDLAGCVRTVVEEVANYANINYKNEEEKITTKQINLDSYINKSVEDTKTKLENLGLKVVVIGSGDKIVNQNPLKNQTVIKGETVFLVTNKKPYIMPNMSKWSSADAIMFAKLIGIKYDVNGYGKVVSTSISEGSEINLDDTLVINLEK